jgi:murein DD-endopeptidase MepM/ murein hydrolase activator NlpD
MRSLVGPIRSPARLAFAAGFCVLVAGCSSESSRFNDSPFSNPFASKSPSQGSDVTGSIGAPRSAPPQTSRIETTPLPPPPSRGAGYSGGMSSGGGGMSSYQPRPVQGDITGSVSNVPQNPPSVVSQVPPPSAPNQGSWNWDGGTAISVGPNETIDVIANRYGVPANAIAQANGISPGTPIHSGQRLIIPRYNSSGTPMAAAAPAAAPRPVVARPPVAAPQTTAAAAVTGKYHVVAPGENLAKIAALYGKPVNEVASANNMQPYKPVRIGEKILIPGVRASASAPAPLPAPVASTAPRAMPPQAQPQRVVQAEPQNSARMITPAAEQPAPQTPAAEAEPMGNATGFRWPVRGRVIAGFGPKPTGQQNDGINLAVPEGTPVKAADDGVVAYAGNELKGYGNLVLVRHSNGLVTAYAHASELMVKRGDNVKRGQVIAKSGQTGNVTSPQLHFEVRKGTTPVDPMQFLTGAT